MLRISLLYCYLYTREEGRFFSISLTHLSRNLSGVVFVDKTNSNSNSSPPFCSASIREGSVALSVGHPHGTHSRYLIGCCLFPLGVCGLKNNSRRITYGIGCVWGMPSLSPLSSLGTILATELT